MAPRWSCVAAGLAAVAIQAPLAASITADMQKVLDQHNQYRCMHNVPLMTWDDAVAANAQAWADLGNWGHSSGASRVVNGVQCGENIAWGPVMTGDVAAQNWYKEIQYTSPYGLAQNFTDSTPPGQTIGHYTQVVWMSSVRLGCGLGRAIISGTSGNFWVCQYSPAGNYQGQFPTQVVAPVKTASQCPATAAANTTTTGPPTGGTTTTAGGATTTTTRGTQTTTQTATMTTTPPPPPGNPGCGLLPTPTISDFERTTGMVLRRCQGPLKPAGVASSPSPGYASPAPFYNAPSPSYSQSPPPNQTNGSNGSNSTPPPPPPPNQTNASNGSNASPPPPR